MMRRLVFIVIALGLATMPPGAVAAPRVVVLNSDALKVVVALDAAQTVVGLVQTNQDYSRWIAPDTPRVGKFDNPAIEIIAALRPDLIIAYDQWPAPALLEDKLAALDVSVRRIACYRYNDSVGDISALGALLDRAERAAVLTAFVARVQAELRQRLAGQIRRRTAYQEYNDYCAAGPGSGGAEILTAAGLDTVARGFSVPMPRVAAEWVLTQNPDVIIKVLYTGMPVNDTVLRQFVARPGWERLAAVRSGRVLVLSNELWAGPFSVVGAFYAAALSYPEAFADRDPGQLFRDMYQLFYGQEPQGTYVVHHSAAQ